MLPDMNIQPLSFEKSNHAYSGWDDDEQNIRRFLLTSNIGMSAWFESQEEYANEQGFAGVDPSEAYGDEGFSAYMDNIGLLQGDYWSSLAASAVKNAVSIFEIYLEDSADALLSPRGWALAKKAKGNSWLWHECHEFYETIFGLDLDTPPINAARWIRNKLTHLHDTLRTDDHEVELKLHRKTLGLEFPETEIEKPLGLHRTTYAPMLGLPNLELTPLDAWRILDTLRLVVHQLAPSLGECERMRATTDALTSLASTGLIPSKPKGIIPSP